MTPKKRILICCISPAENGFFVPSIYGNLRSWCDQFEQLREEYDWIDPVMLPVDYEELNEEIDFSTVDVVGISCYQWNYSYLYGLASLIKEINPKCTVIAGGPHVEYQLSDYFLEHPYIDFTVPGEGEIPFQKILTSLLDLIGVYEIQGVNVNPGLGVYQFRPAPEIDLSSRPSPWLALKDFWTGYFEKYASYRLAVNYESSRGCPYRCTYCDWGNSSRLDVRFVPTETAKGELKFIQQNLRPPFVFWADGNLGLAKRDVDLVEYFSENKRRTGSPEWLYYNCNKKDIDSNLLIARYLRRANLLTKYVLALQHTDEEVLQAIKRINLPKAQILQLVEQLQKEDCPLFVQLIAGCPGDSFEKWLSCFTELMEMGIHGEYRVYPFSLLPNSPAAQPSYRDKWALKVIDRPDYVAYFSLRDKQQNWALSKSRYVVSNKTLKSSDYLKTLELGYLIMTLHDHGFTRMIAKELTKSGVMSYSQFYRDMYTLIFESGVMDLISAKVHNHLHNWIIDDNTTLMIYNNEIEGLVEPEEELVWRVFENFDFFYARIKDYLMHFPGIPEELIDYQRDILFRPEYQPSERETFSPEWARYFNPKLDSSGQYRIDRSVMRFQMPLWFTMDSKKKRDRAFYSQIIQHNVPQADRTVFKKLINVVNHSS